MEKMKDERSLQKKSAHFRPDSKYIKDALAEYENRGGTITKISTKTGYYSATDGMRKSGE